MEEEFSGRIKKESRETLWQRDARENTSTRARIVHKGGDSDIRAVQKMWREGMSCKGKQETRDDQELTKIVWMHRESGTVQRSKSATKQHMTKRVRRYSQKRGVVERRSGEPLKC